MFKSELWQSHDEYRTLVSKMGRRLSRNNPKYSFDSYDEECQKLLNLNLDLLTEFIQDFYSKGGCPALHQAQILRSLILFVLLFNKTKARTSLTLWVKEVLPNSISLTVLIGCPSTDDLTVSGDGTATRKHGTSDIPCTCSVPEIKPLKLTFPCS